MKILKSYFPPLLPVHVKLPAQKFKYSFNSIPTADSCQSEPKMLKSIHKTLVILLETFYNLYMP